jgi:hypothetical protein
MYTHGRKQGCRISLDYTYKGLQIAYLENELLRVGLLLDKGADVFEFTYKPCDLDFLWQSPLSLRRPFAATNALPEGAFHDYYYGGWQEILPSAGWSDSPYQGTYQGLHGEVSLLPVEAHLLRDTEEEVALVTKVNLYRSPLKLERTFSLKRGIAALFIRERLVNESSGEFAIMWGHHPALGEPFLDDSCVVQTPASKVEVMEYHPNGLWQPGDNYDFPKVTNRRTKQLEDITRILPQTTRSVDVLFLKELAEGWYGITNHRLGVGFGMAWDIELFKYLWMWQVYGGHTDYPWYGRTYTCALEPFTSYPPTGINNAIKNGSARIMQPGEIIDTEIVAVAYQQPEIKRINLSGIVE